MADDLAFDLPGEGSEDAFDGGVTKLFDGPARGADRVVVVFKP